MPDVMKITDGDQQMGVEEWFRARLADLNAPYVLEVGTRRSNPDFPTHHKAWLPPSGRMLMVDAFDGIDVDLVQDAHVYEDLEDGSFDAAIAVSVWEHLSRPWVAARALARVLQPGSPFLVVTHQTFPIHGYPSDFFRFSDEALKVLFGDAGFTDLRTEYAFPCTITPPREVTRWNTAAESYLNVAIAGTLREV
jgi:SAM-dependent methyltransferase